MQASKLRDTKMYVEKFVLDVDNYNLLLNNNATVSSICI